MANAIILRASPNLRHRLRLGYCVRLEWHVGDVIRKIREQRRWNQKKLGTASGGLNVGTIVAAEKNGNVKRETLEAIASGLGITVAALYNLVPLPTETQRADKRPPAAVGERFSDSGQERRRENMGPPSGTPERREA